VTGAGLAGADMAGAREDWAREDWAREDWAREDWAREDWARADWARADWARADWAMPRLKASGHDRDRFGAAISGGRTVTIMKIRATAGVSGTLPSAGGYLIDGPGR
jgi:hypothetical protein